MARAKLNQIIAIEKGHKGNAHSVMSDLYKLVQKAEPFLGLSRTYSPIDDGSAETYPPENKKVTYTWTDVVGSTKVALSQLMSVTARKDWTNTAARADIIIDGQAVLKDVPVPYLLFLEKTVTDIATLVKAFPVLDEAETWTYDAAAGLSRSEVVRTHKTKKVAKPIVLYPATTEHPAQTQLLQEDITVGHWSQQKISGAISKTEKAKLLGRITALQNAVKEARETANMQEEVETPDTAAAVLGYIFDGGR